MVQPGVFAARGRMAVRMIPALLAANLAPIPVGTRLRYGVAFKGGTTKYPAEVIGHEAGMVLVLEVVHNERRLVPSPFIDESEPQRYTVRAKWPCECGNLEVEDGDDSTCQPD